MCIEACVEWQLPFHFSDHWFNPDRAAAGHGAALSAYLLGLQHAACVCVCMCVCARAGTPVSVHVIGWHKAYVGVHSFAFSCVKPNTVLLFMCVCRCPGCNGVRESARRPEKCAAQVDCSGKQMLLLMREGRWGGRGKRRKLNWYVNDRNSHLSWRLRVLQH